MTTVILLVLLVPLVLWRWIALTITNAQVIHVDGQTSYVVGQLGETVANAAMPLYKSSVDNKYYKALNDTAPHANVVAFSAAGGLANQTVAMFPPGYLIQLGAGAAPVVNLPYCVGAVAGTLVPIADVTSGMFLTVCGYGKATTTLDTSKLFVTGTAVP